MIQFCPCGAKLRAPRQLNSSLKVVPAGLTQSAKTEILIFQCADCHSVVVSHQDTETPDYKANSPYYTSEIGSLSGARYKYSILDIFKKIVSDPSSPLTFSSPILEIGFGNGSNLKSLSLSGFTSVYGIETELSTSSIDHYQGVSLARGCTLDRLPVHFPSSFDAIYSVAVLEHVDDIQVHFQQLSCLLNPGGHLLIHYPNIRSISARIGIAMGYWDMLFEPGHKFIPSSACITRITRHLNLSVVKTYTCTIRSRGRLPIFPFRSDHIESIIRRACNSSQLFCAIYAFIIDTCDFFLGGDTIMVHLIKY